MKRSVAIRGATPPWVRWAILYNCPLREPARPGELTRVADLTFRRLRGLREFGEARTENRIRSGVCLHPETVAAGKKLSGDVAAETPGSPHAAGLEQGAEIEQAMGFFAEEVLLPFGGEASVDQCCQGCPANALRESRAGAIAGCYGSLPATAPDQGTPAATNSTRRGQPAVDLSGAETEPGLAARYPLLADLDQAISNLNAVESFDANFLPTRPHWFGIWQSQVPNEAQLKLLEAAFVELLAGSADDRLGTPATNAKSSSAFFDQPLAAAQQLLHAIQRCLRNQLQIQFEAIVPGFSDGLHWQLQPTCPQCGCGFTPFDVQASHCPACGRRGNPQSARKFKVLGLRPYVQLKSVLGQQKMLELIREHKH